MPESALGLLGLAARARSLAVGAAAVREGLQRGEVLVVVLAEDRSARTADKVERLARAKGVPVVRGPTATALGARLGRDTVQAVGVTDRSVAKGLLAKLSSRQ